MYLIDTHTHLSFEQFDTDIQEVVRRANDTGVEKFCIPNIGWNSIDSVKALCKQYPAVCFPMIGLHPTNVLSNYAKELSFLHEELKNASYIAIGEIGIDLYWDKTYWKEQKIAFEEQLRWSMEWNLPVSIHVRDAFPQVFESLYAIGTDKLRGVFHCFGGEKEHLKEILSCRNFMIGISGTITYKNVTFRNDLPLFPIERILLETDSPYLPPVPFRGKRNEPSYMIYTAQKIAEIYHLPVETVIKKTTENAIGLFGI